MKALVILLLVVACSHGEHRAAREKYNAGVELLAKGDHEAAEKALLDARSAAGVDPELRFRAAYNLGLAYAAHADKVKAGQPPPAGGTAASPDLAKALELEQQAVSWFSDAARLRKDDADTQANLAIVRARAQAIADELRKGEGKLEARLDAVINDQRSVLEEARGAWVAIKQAGGTDPLAQQGTLTHLADKERGIVAEVGVITDIATDEIDAIGKKPEDQRNDEEKVRVVQLKNLDLYIVEGRNRIGEARRKLQDLAAEDAVSRAEAALVALKRAREQLLDPITVLREVAQDEVVVLQQTDAVDQAQNGKIGDTSQRPMIPAWLDAPALAERQSGLRDRVEEVRARLGAATEGPPPKDAKPEQLKLLERVKVALPHVDAATAAMDKARTKLTEKSLKDAGLAERDALVALAAAIEQFADLKRTIDLTSESHKQVVSSLTAKTNATETKEALAQNLKRMTRIKELIADEVAKLSSQEAPKEDDKKKQLEAQKQLMTQAESLRADAEKLIGQLDAALKVNKDPLTPAKATDAKLDELRRLFFSVIEHLQDLIRQQGETRDQTSQANGEDDEARAPKLPGLVQREEQHDQLAKAITDALAAQADAGQKAQDPQQQQMSKNMAAAADEVRLAQNDMGDAKNTLDKAVKTTNQSFSLEPSVKSQASAIEHLQNALKLLQPPQQNPDKQDKQQDKQQEKDKKKDEQQPQQGGAGQRARDEDARRQKEKRDHDAHGDEVEKDW